jgi:hypothetical protein
MNYPTGVCNPSILKKYNIFTFRKTVQVIHTMFIMRAYEVT